MSRYQNASIYKIVCNDPNVKDCYIGSTCNLYKRKSQHKTVCHNEKYKNYNLRVYDCIRANGGWGNWSVIQIEAYPCNSKRELELRERHHLEELKANLNCCIPTRSSKQYSKQYIEIHRERINERKKEYRKNNKDKIKENRSKLVQCRCGAITQKRAISDHKKTEKHLYYERISEFINS